MHDGAAREVERAQLRQPAAAPDPVRDRGVDDDRPERDEGEVRPKRMRSTIAPEISAAVMIANVPWYAMNSTCGIVALRLEADAAQESARRVADPVVARRERQRVADERPGDADERRAR